MTAPELKPCPFCGGSASISKDHDPEGSGAFYAVKCHKCRAKSSEIYAVETCNIHFTQVRDAWNRRADLAAVPAQVGVKSLVWEEPCYTNNWVNVARSVFGDYYIGIDGGRHSALLEANMKPYENKIGDDVGSVIEAMMIAERDHEAKTRALIIEPQPDHACCLGLTAMDCADVPSRHCAGSQPDPRDEHFDDYAVRSFAKMMAAKMAASRAKGRGGWYKPEQCSVEYLRRLLYTHLDKGDPVDVANICMMLRHYEASTAHEYESSAMAAACASRDAVIARLVEAAESAVSCFQYQMMQGFSKHPMAQAGIDQLSAAIAAAKAVQHG